MQYIILVITSTLVTPNSTFHLNVGTRWTEFIILISPLLKQNLGDLSISVGDKHISPSSKVTDQGVVLTNISLFIIILMVFVSQHIFTCAASESFRTF